jgi:hypothetical protein
MSDDLTPEEKHAIAALKRLAKRWPKSLWLYSASGTLNVMRCEPDGVQHFRPCGRSEGVDPDYIVATVDGIPNDGGDW